MVSKSTCSYNADTLQPIYAEAIVFAMHEPVVGCKTRSLPVGVCTAVYLLLLMGQQGSHFVS